jgi:hypothetical protein
VESLRTMRQVSVGAILLGACLLFGSANSKAQCPQNSIQLSAFDTGALVTSTGAARDTSASSTQGSAAAGSYDLLAGFLTSYASGNASADVSTHDVFTVSGPPVGTPITILAHVRVRGGIHTQAEDFISRSARFGITIREGTSNSKSYGRFVSSRVPPYELGIDSTLTISILTTVGSSFDLHLNLTGQGTHGGTSNFRTGGLGAQLSFSGLPSGVSLASCQGFRIEQPIPVLPATWSSIKVGH